MMSVHKLHNLVLGKITLCNLFILDTEQTFGYHS